MVVFTKPKSLYHIYSTKLYSKRVTLQIRTINTVLNVYITLNENIQYVEFFIWLSQNII